MSLYCTPFDSESFANLHNGRDRAQMSASDVKIFHITSSLILLQGNQWRNLPQSSLLLLWHSVAILFHCTLATKFIRSYWFWMGDWLLDCYQMEFIRCWIQLLNGIYSPWHWKFSCTNMKFAKGAGILW